MENPMLYGSMVSKMEKTKKAYMWDELEKKLKNCIVINNEVITESDYLSYKDIKFVKRVFKKYNAEIYTIKVNEDNKLSVIFREVI